MSLAQSENPPADHSAPEPVAIPAENSGLSRPASGPPKGLDSPLRTIFGLIVIWGSLQLIFMAHRNSESHARLDVPYSGSFQQTMGFLGRSEPRVRLLFPLTMFSRILTPRQALSNIAGHPGINLKVSDEALERLGEKPQNIKFESEPLYQVIHRLIDNTGRGFALAGRELLIFNQNLNTEGHPKRKYSLEWQASLDLSPEQMLIVPTGETDLWFTLSLRDTVTKSGQAGKCVQVEVWQGEDLLTLSKVELDEQGAAQLSLSTVENIVFSVRHVPDPASDKTNRYELKFYYQSFEKNAKD